MFVLEKSFIQHYTRLPKNTFKTLGMLPFQFNYLLKTKKV